MRDPDDQTVAYGGGHVIDLVDLSNEKATSGPQ
jgi:hypothetical protein